MSGGLGRRNAQKVKDGDKNLGVFHITPEL